jgi:excisionase family DNA binding protein
MPAATKKRPRTSGGAKQASHANGDILTLSEAAEYLRLNEEELKRLVSDSDLPGRQIGNEWRFFKTALQSWLSTPRRATGMKAVLAMAGKFKNDPFLEEIVREAYRQRGRPSQPEES